MSRIALGLVVSLTAAAVPLTVPSAPAAAQSALVTSGAHVRISSSTPALSRRVGRVVDLSRDTLWLETDDSHERLGISRAAVTALDVGDGHGTRGHHAGAGAALGLFAGAMLGATSGYSSSCSHCDGDWRPFGALVGGAAGGILGLLVGTTVGLAMPVEHWAPVASSRVASGTSARTDIGVGVMLRF